MNLLDHSIGHFKKTFLAAKGHNVSTLTTDTSLEYRHHSIIPQFGRHRIFGTIAGPPLLKAILKF